MKQTQTKADAAPASGQHTPGQWSTGAVMTRVEVLPNGWNMPVCIADCHAKNAPKSESERVANAKLIAQAPQLRQDRADLLAALARSARNFADILDNHPAVWPAKGRKDALTPEERACRDKIDGFKTEARAALARAERGEG